MEHRRQDDAYTDQRMPTCSYYSPPPQNTYPIQNNYYKEPYIPETVEFAQMPDNYGYQANLESCVKSEPSDFNAINESLLPHNMMGFTDVEKYKLERKRERNRIAASKCRMRKIERIQQLDEEVSRLKTENEQLGETAERLKQEVKRLQAQIKLHRDNGCNMQSSQFHGPDSTC